MSAFTLSFAGAVFKQLGYFSAILALVFVNQHNIPHSKKVNIVCRKGYIMIISFKYQHLYRAYITTRGYI
jgi:hypothetical protein